MPMPGHQDGRRVCGRLLQEMHGSRLATTGYARACKPITEPDDHRNRESKRFGGPLLSHRIRPLYVRNQRGAAAPADQR